MDKPLEARCDHCHQLRPLFLYEPAHSFHLGYRLTCRWCERERQPLLCVRCWGAEREMEERDPVLAEEAATLEEICAANRRADEREQADRETCEGIAHATAATEDGAS